MSFYHWTSEEEQSMVLSHLLSRQGSFEAVRHGTRPSSGHFFNAVLPFQGSALLLSHIPLFLKQLFFSFPFSSMTHRVVCKNLCFYSLSLLLSPLSSLWHPSLITMVTFSSCLFLIHTWVKFLKDMSIHVQISQGKYHGGNLKNLVVRECMPLIGNISFQEYWPLLCNGEK